MLRNEAETEKEIQGSEGDRAEKIVAKKDEWLEWREEQRGEGSKERRTDGR